MGVEGRPLGDALNVGGVPHIARIEEGCTAEDASQGEAQLGIGLESEVTELARVAAIDLGRGARAECAHTPAAHTIHTAGIEELVGGQRLVLGVAIGYDDASVESVGEGQRVVERESLCPREVGAQILCVAYAEECVVAVGLGGSHEALDAREEVAACGQAHTQGVIFDLVGDVLCAAGVGARDAGHHLSGVAVAQIGVLEPVEEVGAHIVHLDHTHIEGAEHKEVAVAVGPAVAEAHIGEHAVVELAVLVVYGELQTGLRVQQIAPRVEVYGEEELGEGHADHTAQLCGVAIGGGGLTPAELIAEGEAHIYLLGTAEEVLVLIADGGRESVEARGEGGFEVGLDALAHSGREPYLAVQHTFGCFGRVAPVVAHEGHLAHRLTALLREEDVGAVDVVHAHKVLIGVGHPAVVEHRAAAQTHQTAQYGGAYVGPATVVDNLEALIVERVEREEIVGIGGRLCGVVVGQHAYGADAVEGVVGVDGLALPVAPLEVLLDYEPHSRTMLPKSGVYLELNVVLREVVETVAAQQLCEACALLAEGVDVEDVAALDERERVGTQEFLDVAVLDVVGDALNAIGLSLCGLVDDLGRTLTVVAQYGVLLACGEETARGDIGADIFGTATGECRVDNDGRGAHTA